MFPASAVTISVLDYLELAPFWQLARAATMQPRHCCGFSSNAATAKLEVHINLIFLRGAACRLGQLVPWGPPQWTAELKFHKDQGCFWNPAIGNVAKCNARCLNLLCECRPQLVWKFIHACDSHSLCCYNKKSLERTCTMAFNPQVVLAPHIQLISNKSTLTSMPSEKRKEPALSPQTLPSPSTSRAGRPAGPKPEGGEVGVYKNNLDLEGLY